MNADQKISDKVKALIEKNMDAYEGFKTASERSESMNLRDFLMDQAEARKEFAAELKNVLKSYDPNVDVESNTSVGGTIHRGWLNFKSAVSGDSDKSILEESIRGDKASAEEYKEYLDNCNAASADISHTVRRQLDKIIDALDNEERLKGIL